MLGFEIDANVSFCCMENNVGCDFLYQERHDETNCMLTLRCKFANNVSYQQMADYLEEKWLEHVCYQEFEKHYIEVVNDQLIFLLCDPIKLWTRSNRENCCYLVYNEPPI
ncbi:hypothetical protein [Psychrobacter sp. JCM 18900]|uniref:hypothetical protein n=1 Tax=Psychrobacter sp. JCM 18900 TaxID=1298608 RepID=UPI0021C3E74E|nr:hypothetical protein [Psychrobacter sp. JCM 18900]